MVFSLSVTTRSRQLCDSVNLEGHNTLLSGADAWRMGCVCWPSDEARLEQHVM